MHSTQNALSYVFCDARAFFKDFLARGQNYDDKDTLFK